MRVSCQDQARQEYLFNTVGVSKEMLIAMNSTGQSQEHFAMAEGGGEGSQNNITKDIVAFNFALVSCTLANRTQIDMTKTSKGKQHFYGLIHFKLKKSIT